MVVSLRKAHNRNSSVLTEKSFELKTRYATYELHKLTKTIKALHSSAELEVKAKVGSL